ncbi:MAG: TonB-dependent receptor [Verrucomicrobia bacterium]|nr:TonB-dependent receptor [Verrucomicrobiota bacterium]
MRLTNPSSVPCWRHAGMLLALVTAAIAAPSRFDIAAQPADAALLAFSKQAGAEVLFASDQVANVRTNAVVGQHEPAEAIMRLLADTGLAASRGANGKWIVGAAGPAPSAPRATAAPAPAPAASEPARAVRSAAAPATAEPALQMAAFEVTGSHIKRLEGEGPLPVAAYSRSDIDARGFLNTGDFLQSLSFNSGTTNSIGVPAANPVSNVPFARGAVTMNPRGLGAGRFLVLLDGKRPSSYGLPDNRGGSVFDLNSIPTEAIAGIEYLKDGASAIYGSDAIAGVMNVKLRGDFNGFTTSAMLGNTLGHDTFTRTLSLLSGETSAKGSYLLNVNWFTQNGNFAQDYDRSRSTDYTSFGPVKGQNNNSPSNFPFNITLTAAQAAQAGFTTGAGFYVVNGGAPAASPQRSNFVSAGANQNAATNANRYDFAPTTQLTPNQENFSAMFRATRELGDAVRGSVRLLANKNLTGIVYTPISINSASILNTDGTPLTIPATNPYNPFGFALSNFRGRGNFGPTRTFNVETTGLTSIFGLEGKLPAGWSWAADFIYGSSLFDQNAGNQVRTADMQAALNGTLSGFAGRFFNPFGPSANQGLVNALFVTSTASSKATTVGADASASGPLFEMPALVGGKSPGSVSLAVGLERRKDNLDNHADPIPYLVTVGDLPYSGNRVVTSAYAELDVPIIAKSLTLQLAGRYDRYDTFGSTTNPKLAFVAQPVEFLKIRGSYSRSFKAPDIGQLYQPSVTTFTAALSDPRNPALGLNTYPFIAAGNRTLRPETGRVWYGGVVVDAGRLVKGLSVSADYFDIGLDHVITSFTTPTVFFNFFPERVVRNAAGVIQYFDAKTINAAGYKWKGADFGLDYKLRGTRAGDFAFNAQVTYIDTFALNAGSGAGFINTAGRYNNPRIAGSGQIGWKRGTLAATLGTQFKGTYLMDQFAPAWRENAQFLFNGTFSFDAPWRSRFTLGCNNLLDAEAPINGKAIPSYGYDVATYNAWSMGRFVYVKVTKDF